MSKQYQVAVVGATGAVGEVLIEILAEREFPIETLVPLASEHSVGETIFFGDKALPVRGLSDFDFSGIDFAFFMASSEVAQQYAPLAAEKGCVVIDNSAYFRYDPDVPLVIPEVNPETLAHYHSRIIANPNCSTIQMLVALKPIYDQVGIERINVVTFQSVSGAGKAAIEELAKQTVEIFNAQAVTHKVFPTQIAFNVIAHVDALQENGYTREEMKMILETQKILNDPHILVNATAVRVPVFYGHSEAIHLETRDPMSAEEAKNILSKIPGITVVDEYEEPATPVTHAASKDEVIVSRIRQDLSHPRGLNLWVLADNIRKGAALNAVQIAELLIAKERARLTH